MKSDVVVFLTGLSFLLILFISKRDKEVVVDEQEIATIIESDNIHEHKNCIDSTMKLVKNFEGYSDTIYVCPGGSKTIGYGFTYPNIWNKKTISRFEADSVLKNHLTWCMKMAERDSICCERASAIGSFIYNLGYGNYKKSRVRDAVIRGDSLDVMLDYCYASGKRLRGLEKRRKKELLMYNSFKN